jgi:hypothetical protein
MDALSRSNSGVLIEKDHSLYYAIPSLDLPLINTWIQSQKSIFPDLRICGIYSTDDINLLDLELMHDKMYYISNDIVYKVVWLDSKLKELGYYTTQISKLDLRVDTIQYKQESLQDLYQKIISDLSNLDLKNDTRFLLNALSTKDLDLKEIRVLLQKVISQTRMEGAKSF